VKGDILWMIDLHVMSMIDYNSVHFSTHTYANPLVPSGSVLQLLWIDHYILLWDLKPQWLTLALLHYLVI